MDGIWRIETVYKENITFAANAHTVVTFPSLGKDGYTLVGIVGVAISAHATAIGIMTAHAGSTSASTVWRNYHNASYVDTASLRLLYVKDDLS